MSLIQLVVKGAGGIGHATTTPLAGGGISLLTLITSLAWAMVLSPPKGSGWMTTMPWWVIAVGSVLLLSFIVVVRQFIRDRQDAAARQELENATAGLPKIVSTMPTGEFMSALNLGFEKSYVIGRIAEREAEDSTSLELACRLTLKAIAGAARTFDRGEDAGKHPICANIMWFVKKDDVLATKWDSSVLFRNPGVTLSGVQGLLVLSPNYSATSTTSDDSDDPNPDPKLQSFALDVAENPLSKSQDGTRYAVLPGAPLVYIDKAKVEHFHPSADVQEWMKKHAELPRPIQEEVGAYFTDSPHVAGFMSLPLYRPSAAYVEDCDREVLGILNLHWGADVRLLGKAVAARKLAEALYPMRVLLGSLMGKVVEHGWIPRPDGVDA